MGMLDICSNASYWRGLDYFESKRVKQLHKINNNEYEAIVSGTEDYRVVIDTKHPRKSTCTCPHANGKSVICKHKVSVYFAAFPEAVDEAKEIRENYYREQEEKERRIEEEMKKKRKSVQKYVDSLSEEEAREMLVDMILNDSYKQYDDRDDDF